MSRNTISLHFCWRNPINIKPANSDRLLCIVYSNGKVVKWKTLLIYNTLVSENPPSTNGSFTSWRARLYQDTIGTDIVLGSAQNRTHLWLNDYHRKWPRILTYTRSLHLMPRVLHVDCKFSEVLFSNSSVLKRWSADCLKYTLLSHQ